MSQSPRRSASNTRKRTAQPTPSNIRSRKTAPSSIRLRSRSRRRPVRRSKTTTKESKIKIEWDKRSGGFELKSKDYRGRESGVKGTLNKKGDRYIFVLEKLISRGKSVSTVKSLELTVTIDRHDPTPNVPGNFTEITKMDERDFKRLPEDIHDGFKELWEDYFK